MQKQYAGDGWMLGMAGSGLAASVILRELAATPNLTAAAIHDWVEAFVMDTFTPSEIANIAAVLVAPVDGEPRARLFYPGRMRRMLPPMHSASIGSGSEFVENVIARYRRVGRRPWATGHPVDLFVAAVDLATAADESLTVDDNMLVSFLFGGKTYLLGHNEIQPRHAPDAVIDAWPQLAAVFDLFVEAADSITVEMKAATVALQTVSEGKFPDSTQQTLASSAQSIGAYRSHLHRSMQQLFDTYDDIVGRQRSSLPPL